MAASPRGLEEISLNLEICSADDDLVPSLDLAVVNIYPGIGYLLPQQLVPDDTRHHHCNCQFHVESSERLSSVHNPLTPWYDNIYETIYETMV